MENIKLVQNMEAYQKVKNLKKEIEKKKNELEIAEATLKTQEKSREDFHAIVESRQPDIDGINNSERRIISLSSEISRLNQELETEEEKIK